MFCSPSTTPLREADKIDEAAFKNAHMPGGRVQRVAKPREGGHDR